jgi:hypothetical protein
LKTALTRIPFAVIGIIGIFIMVWIFTMLFEHNPTHKLLFLIFFFFLELFSVSLALHLREARYYPLLFLISAFIFCSYICYRFLGRMGNSSYIVITAVSLFLAFNTFMPLYFIFIAAIGLHELCLLVRKKIIIRDFIFSLIPFFASMLLLLPQILYLDIFKITSALSQVFPINEKIFLSRIFTMLFFLKNYEFLHLTLYAKLFLALLLVFRALRAPQEEEARPEIMLKVRVSNFLSLFLLVYILMIARLPQPYIFERYYIILQPIVVIILLLDIFTAVDLLNQLYSLGLIYRTSRLLFALFFSIMFISNIADKTGDVRNHIYELFHQYKGPLDFIIPYIKQKYKNSEDLIIATNYEECSYMYYLKSKVIVGCFGRDLESDLQLSPDIIIFRNRWTYATPHLQGNPFYYSHKNFDSFLKKQKYKRLYFPVSDYDVNNIPELAFVTYPHLYRTKLAKKPGQRLVIFLKDN